MDIDNSVAKYLPFLSEIRKRLLFLLAVFFITGVLGFIYYEKIIKFSLSLFSLEGVNIVFTSPFQFVSLAFTSAFLLGTIIIFPLIVFQVISFLKPALNSKEYRSIVSLIPFSLILFTTGFGFGIIVMRYVVRLFYKKSVELQIGNFLDVSTLLSQILLTSVLMGLAFQFPIILTILVRLKIIKYRILEKQRLWAYLASLIFAILLPPTDLLSMFLLFLPLVLLFEFTLLLNRWILKTHLL
ncbi:MAG: sec-independent protein translocase protein TatC [Microgenomates group bacterium Gr01-1014_80]|nr:MAG: sec-independent protein translocase protein TatC [Microgenomates group bacterium Gr01-1014_80]